MVAGCWRDRIFGLTVANASVQFQYRQGSGPWTPIGVANEDTYASDWLIVPGGHTRYFSPYWADWKPANGTYQVRMLASYDGQMDESLSPILNVTVSGGVCTYTGTPAGFGPGSIERNLENDCYNLIGLAASVPHTVYPTVLLLLTTFRGRAGARRS